MIFEHKGDNCRNVYCGRTEINLSEQRHEDMHIRSVNDRYEPCLLCGKDIKYRGPHRIITWRTPIPMKEGYLISYTRCVSCIIQENFLCIHTLKATKGSCPNDWKSMLILFYWALPIDILDIKREILKYCDNLNCCKALPCNTKNKFLLTS